MDEAIQYGREVVRLEAAAVAGLGDHLDASFSKAVAMVLACSGHVLVTGMGKSGLIAQKISATLASTGTPSFHLHPAEAVHGDLGRVTADSLVIALSNSGTVEEIRRLIPSVKRLGAPLVAITGNRESSLARHADCVLWTGAAPEACPVGLAPTTSTTAQLAMGDALAMTVAKQRNFTREEYAIYHPGGALGRSLLRVHELMHHAATVPAADADITTRAALMAADAGGRRPGALPVRDATGQLVGLLTDGDVRRLVLRDPSFLEAKLASVMTPKPLAVRRDRLAAEAWRLMHERGFDELPVVDDDGNYVGLLDVQNLVAAGFTKGA